MVSGSVPASPQERWRYIFRVLQSDATVSTARLCREMAVSGETVRRDLKVLEGRGLLKRVYGGAIAPNSARTSEPPYPQRAGINAEAKLLIGEKAARLVTGEGSVFLDVGTTTAAVAQALAAGYRGVVTTASLLVANAFSDAADARLIVVPGQLRPGERSLTGTSTHDFLRRMHFDVALLSCGGVDASTGATDFNFEDVEIKRTVAANSRRTYVLADSTKFGVVGSFEIGTWHDLTGLIADRVPPDGIAAAARRAGSELVVASPRE